MNRTRLALVCCLLLLCMTALTACGGNTSGVTSQDVARKLGMTPPERSFSPEEPASFPLESRADGCLDGYRSMEPVIGEIGGRTEVLYLFRYSSHESVVEAMTLPYSGTGAVIAYGDRVVLLYYGGNPAVLEALRKNYTVKQ